MRSTSVARSTTPSGAQNEVTLPVPRNCPVVQVRPGASRASAVSLNGRPSLELQPTGSSGTVRPERSSGPHVAELAAALDERRLMRKMVS